MNIASVTPTIPSDFSAKLGQLRTLLADIAQSAPAAASETLDGLKDKASAVCDTCEKTANNATHLVVKTVKENPGKVALVVVGAGLLAWWLLSRSCAKAE